MEFPTGIQQEIIRRMANNWHSQGRTGAEIYEDILWALSLEQVTTEEGFRRAGAGESVFMIYADGTDSQLDDIETERWYYKDSKTYPEIETIFVKEREKKDE